MCPEPPGARPPGFIESSSVKLPKDGADTERNVSRAASGRNVWKYRGCYPSVVEGHGFQQVLRNNVVDENPNIFFSANFVSFFQFFFNLNVFRILHGVVPDVKFASRLAYCEHPSRMILGPPATETLPL